MTLFCFWSKLSIAKYKNACYINAERKSIINSKKDKIIMAFDIKKVPFIKTQKVVAFEDRLIVYPDPVEEIKKESGLIVPVTAQEELKKGTVVLIGSTVLDSRIEIGSRLTYGKHAGQPFPFGGHVYQAIRPTEGIVWNVNDGADESEYVHYVDAHGEEITPDNPTRQKATMQA